MHTSLWNSFRITSKRFWQHCLFLRISIQTCCNSASLVCDACTDWLLGSNFKMCKVLALLFPTVLSMCYTWYETWIKKYWNLDTTNNQTDTMSVCIFWSAHLSNQTWSQYSSTSATAPHQPLKHDVLPQYQACVPESDNVFVQRRQFHQRNSQ